MSEKSIKVEDLLEKIMPGQAARQAAGLCPHCAEPIASFRNALSEREYQISGLCQKCQDVVFGKD